MSINVLVPDIGDSSDVEVIEIFVKPGDKIEKDDSLITLESEKAAMEIPSAYSGVVESIAVSVGDKLSEGSLILTLQGEEAVAPETKAAEAEGVPPKGEVVEAPAEEVVPVAESAAEPVERSEEIVIPDIGDATDASF